LNRLIWDLAIETGLDPKSFETADDIMTVMEILEERNG